VKISSFRCSISLLLVLGALGAQAQSSTGKVTRGGAIRVKSGFIDRTPNLDYSAAKAAFSSQLLSSSGDVFVVPDRMPEPDLALARAKSVTMSPPANTLSIPAPKPDALKTAGGASVEFEGLTTRDAADLYRPRYVNSPPDPAICAGNGYVMELTNMMLAVYNTAGAAVTQPSSIYYGVFGFEPSFSYLYAPRCYYDNATQRWFISVINEYDSLFGRSYLALAVSKTSDPAGAYYEYVVDTSDTGFGGTPAHPGCAPEAPCFGAEPLLGADAYGIYVTTNEFGPGQTFNGAQLYAFSKADLEAGKVAPMMVHIANIPLAEGLAYSLQPASSSDIGREAASGVEYFVSALDFSNTLDDRIAVWALTNTQSLETPSPNVKLLNTIVKSEAYGMPPLATQEAGTYELGQSLGDPEEMLQTSDDRMQSAAFAGDHLWAGLNTIVSDGTGNHAGIAYFVVKPSVKNDVLSARLQGQGYVSVKGNSVMYPGIAVTPDGTAAAAFTLSGPSHYPSAAWAHLTPAHATGVNIVAAGVAPNDDFTGYAGTGVALWGDYSSGVADGNSLWFATEYIPGAIDSTLYLTNFGTYVFKLDLP